MVASLVVQSNSLRYVRRVVEFLHDGLVRAFGPYTSLFIGDAVDDIDTGEARLVFVIGEGFPRFQRRDGVRYVYLNFSVVEALGNPFATSRMGWRQLRWKRRLLEDKLDLFDAVMDYYPPQTRKLAASLGIPVHGFLPCVPPTEMMQEVDLAYDVCFVGGLTPRREALLSELAARGIVLSPASGVDLEDVAARSRVTLNVHMQRSNHFEIPRVVGALAAGSPVVSEASYGIDEVMNPAAVINVPYRRLAETVERTLSDAQTLRAARVAARAWYEGAYVPRCQTLLAESLSGIAQGSAERPLGRRTTWNIPLWRLGLAPARRAAPASVSGSGSRGHPVASRPS